jgi:hypothetical protein
MSMKIGILTGYYSNYKPLADIVLPNIEEYCINHGYNMYFYVFQPTDIHYSFLRLQKVRELFESEDIDAVLCCDIDILITNHNTRVESFIDSEHDFYITKDVNGINAGNFIIKNTEWAKEFLDFTLSLQHLYSNDQDVIEGIQESEWMDKIKILPHPSINSYPYDYYAPNWGIIGDKKIEKPTHDQGDWKKGDFIIHLPGKPLQERIDILKGVEVWK